MSHTYDIVIIGTGAGGGTMAYALRNSGANVLLIERGDFLPQEAQNWDPEQAYFNNRYKTTELWYDRNGNSYQPGVHYFVGGNTKVYGAALPRFRREDFSPLEHEGGTSPGWPIEYEELEPYYAEAERIYRVHGEAGHDPTEPPRSTLYPFPPVPHEPYILDLSNRLKKQGLHPFFYPMGVDLREGGACVRCNTCDGFPCKVHAKSDAEVCCIRPSLQSATVTLWTNTYAIRLITDESGRTIQTLEVERDGLRMNVHAGLFILSCGAVNSAALLLRSANSKHPLGLANSSDQVGRNYMVHNNSGLVAIDPRRKNDVVFQKTLAVNDYYLQGPDWPYPLGNLQLVGKVQAPMVATLRPNVPRFVLQAMTERSVDWWIMSEDLPDPDNRVHLTKTGKIQIRWTPNNLATHQKLTQLAKTMLQEAGYPIVFTQPMGIATNSHMCGTLRFGLDPATSVLDPFCKAHDLTNLFIVDASFFPSSAAMNPALTIAAQALRVAHHLMKPG